MRAVFGFGLDFVIDLERRTHSPPYVILIWFPPDRMYLFLRHLVFFIFIFLSEGKAWGLNKVRDFFSVIEEVPVILNDRDQSGHVPMDWFLL